MIQSLSVDVAALQRLEETEPFGLSLVEGGLCGVSCLLLLSGCVAGTCGLVGGTGGAISAPPEK